MKDNNFDEINKVLSAGSSFTIKTTEEFNKCINHILQLIKDSCFLYKVGSYGTSTFLSITIIEEVAKVHMGLYVKNIELKTKDFLKNHVSKQKIATNYTILLGKRLNEAIGVDRIKNIMKLANEKRLTQIREEALYCDVKDNNLQTPSDMIDKKFAREILLFAIESFDDNLVGHSEHSYKISDITDKIFEEIAKKF
ncbi:AbiV family abortive infection protein [Campylobacter lari]|uniref:AbiV family abortive infection protein n=1 Tax=Campylobacter lari TaxID=201 RepID=UPI0021499ADB|nr:AbiV family abortive infection protein [Campylobacter lari]MCR2075836.1 AbiV family abortive infection protein [Campylobacter lari subsp. concheus]MCR2083872.1 AbiV family abortive infection protein [Campylobacter lari subsp. concheus]MCR2085496.1 AbiV family abortive infection protein [Campylobacter lari subsp. concheus]MCV3418374.1 AbiV family abortive infection protein [Campylobacter lari]MCV3421389.1 AbiV family abortive infection protein [Campylobacter lari]